MRIRGLEKREVSWKIRWAYGLMKRQFGKPLTPFTVAARQPRIAFANLIANIFIEHSTDIPASLKRLVCLRAAQLIGCQF